MLLTKTRAGPFKSINQAQTVKIDEKVTVLVGMNEDGKTVFLQTLLKSKDALGIFVFDAVEDYPRKDLSAYLKVHVKKPAEACTLAYRLSKGEVAEVNQAFGTHVPENFEISTHHLFNNDLTIASRADIGRTSAIIVRRCSKGGRENAESQPWLIPMRTRTHFYFV